MKIKTIARLGLLLASVAMLPAVASAEGDRLAFARSMSTLTIGMSAKQVAETLGPPQDVRTQYDPGGISTYHTKEILGYGTEGHLTFPTLGCVYMDDADKVQYIFGDKGTPPDPAMVDEAEVRALLRLIDKLPRGSGPDYNPRDIIQVVNRLHGLGKEEALAIIDEYLRVASKWHSNAREGLFLVLRVLFDVPADRGFMPRAGMGAPEPEEPKDPKLLPRFPILIQDDIPLMLVTGYALAGSPQPVEDHVRYFRQNGKLRDRPLQPTDTPLAVLEKIEHSPQWIYPKTSANPANPSNDQGKTMLIYQLLRLVDSVYRVPIGRYGDKMPAEEWSKTRGEFNKLGARWDGQQNMYVFPDGTHLPEVKPVYYRRNIWMLPTLGPEAQLVIERSSAETITIIVDYGEMRGLRIEQSTLCVAPLAAKDKPIVKKAIRASMGDDAIPLGGYSQKVDYGDVKLPAGESVQAELISGEKRYQSPVFTP